jgi:hypothetical protein
VAGASIPPLSADIEKQVLLTALKTLQPFNVELDAIARALRTDPAAVPQADKNFFYENPDIVQDTDQFLDAITDSLSGLSRGGNGNGNGYGNGNGNGNGGPPPNTPPATGTLNVDGSTPELSPF